MKKRFPNLSKILQKSTFGPSLGRLWGHLGASWEAFWTPVPKRLDFGDLEEGLGSPKRPTWLQLGGPRRSKTESKMRKIDVEKQHVFGIVFFISQT